MNAKNLEQALRSAAPDCVIDLLTAIPKNGPIRASHMRATNQLRVMGTTNLLNAAIAAGTKRIVGESMTFAYGFGDHGEAVKTEDDTLQPREMNSKLQEIVDATRSLEEQLLASDEQGLIDVIILRYGLLYGAESASTRYMLRLINLLPPSFAGKKARFVLAGLRVQAFAPIPACPPPDPLYCSRRR